MAVDARLPDSATSAFEMPMAKAGEVEAVAPSMSVPRITRPASEQTAEGVPEMTPVEAEKESPGQDADNVTGVPDRISS